MLIFFFLSFSFLFSFFFLPFSLRATTYYSSDASSVGHRAVRAGFERALVSLTPFPLMDCPHGSVTLVYAPLSFAFYSLMDWGGFWFHLNLEF